MLPDRVGVSQLAVEGRKQRGGQLVLGHVDPDGLSFRRTGTLCTPRLQHGGVLARQQASRPSASPAFRQLVGKGLATFGRNQVARGWDWDPIDEEVIAPTPEPEQPIIPAFP